MYNSIFFSPTRLDSRSFRGFGYTNRYAIGNGQFDDERKMYHRAPLIKRIDGHGTVRTLKRITIQNTSATENRKRVRTVQNVRGGGRQTGTIGHAHITAFRNISGTCKSRANDENTHC